MSTRYLRQLSLSVVLSMAMSQIIAQSYRRYVHDADSCFKIGEYDASLKFYSQAFAIKSDVPRDFYNAACSASLGGANHFAVALLKLAVDNGWMDINHLESDADLRPLHSMPEWFTLTSDLRKKIEVFERGFDWPLQAELLAVFESANAIRQEYSNISHDEPDKKVKGDSVLKIMRRVDSVNVIKVSKILDERGWVGNDLVGAQASDAIYYAMQHADLQTLVKYFPLLKEAVERKTVRIEFLAYMDDRIAVGQGREQTYGSLLGFNSQTGKYFVHPVKDPQEVDRRRDLVGLGPMNDYVRMYGIKWDPKNPGQEK